MNQQQPRKNKTINSASPHEHFEALSPLLTQLKARLTESAGKKGNYGDYLPIEFYRASRDQQVRK